MSKLSKALIAAAGNSGGAGLTVEDVFSTYLYDGNSSTQTITNNIDLDGEGGLVWLKSRGPTGYNHYLYDTNRGATSVLFSNLTNGAGTQSNGLTAFNNNGFTQGSFIGSNGTGETYASWTFRKAEKFFDVVTYTGNGTAGRTVAHNLGSVPGCIIVKRTDSAADWMVYHKGVNGGVTPEDFYLQLSQTSAQADAVNRWNDTAPTSTEFTLGDTSSVNASGGTYVAYLFASDAGGFGDDGSESIIKCGSFVPPASGEQEIYLGFEPQFIITFDASGGDNWRMFDVMRGWNQAERMQLSPNNTVAEFSLGNTSGYENKPTATGFIQEGHSPGDTHIYIAIRRPMKTPESGTEVFAPNTIASSVPDGTQINSGFAIDMNMIALRGGAGVNFVTHDRLRGVSTTTSNGGLYLETNSTQAESTGFSRYFNNTGFQLPSTLAGSDLISYSFKRATGFFDVVAYTGNGTAGRTVAHNLGVAPEMMIVKQRSASGESWLVYHTGLTSASYEIKLNFPFPEASSTSFNGTAPTSSVFSVGGGAGTNGSGSTYIAYLFATLAGVSKVGSYTGTGSNVDVDCGFSAGARFVLIKRRGVDYSSGWYVWDSERGIVAGNDPYLLLNSTAAEVTSTDYIDPLASGFTVTSTAPAALNNSGETYIFLAIA